MRLLRLLLCRLVCRLCGHNLLGQGPGPGMNEHDLVDAKTMEIVGRWRHCRDCGRPVIRLVKISKTGWELSGAELEKD